MAATKPFFFFGCWNRDNCEKGCPGTDFRGSVLKALENTIVSNTDIEIGIVAGDNIYPQKDKDKNTGKKTKKYYQETWERGIEQLTAATETKDKHVILGNHNVDRNSIRGLHVTLAEEDKTFKLYQDIAAHHTYTDGECDFIFINTNKYTKCREKEVERQLGDALKVCDKDQIYIVGHFPLVAARNKDSKEYVHLEIINTVYDVVNEYYIKQQQEQKVKSIIYLCADVHNFQVLSIKKRGGTYDFPVVVCGTGGASPDDLDGGAVNYMTVGYPPEPQVTYDVTMIHREMPYGYCIVKGKEIEYHKVVSTVPQASKEPNLQGPTKPHDITGLTVSVIYDEVTPVVLTEGNCTFSTELTGGKRLQSPKKPRKKSS